MTAWAALLRGVNVGGRKLAMADLRAATEACGHTDVATYLQSGNVVFVATGRGRTGTTAAVRTRLADELIAAIAEAAGIDVALTLRHRAELDGVIAANPYSAFVDDPTKVHVTFAVATAPTGPPDWYDAAAWAPEELAVVGGETYLHVPDGLGRSRLAVRTERDAKRPATLGTTRNWRTVVALRDLLAERESGGAGTP